jgi:hypothetical protein
MKNAPEVTLSLENDDRQERQKTVEYRINQGLYGAKTCLAGNVHCGDDHHRHQSDIDPNTHQRMVLSLATILRHAAPEPPG